MDAHRDRDGKVTPDEVAAAAMYLKDTLAKEGLQQLISSLSKDKGKEAILSFLSSYLSEVDLLVDLFFLNLLLTEGRVMVEDIVRLGRLGSKPEENVTEEESN